MKKLFVAGILFVCSHFAVTAQVDSAFRFKNQGATFKEAVGAAIEDAIGREPESESEEAGEANSLKKWEYFMGSRICNDVAVGEDMVQPLNLGLSEFLSNMNSYCTSNKGDWKCLGPFTDYYETSYESQGRVTAIWADPGNPDFILAGADAGGLWKSTNGGQTWHCITDGSAYPGILGVNSIAVNPQNHDIIYIAMSITSQYKKSDGYSLGLAYTTDGGTSWNYDVDFNSLVNNYAPYVYKVAYMPGTSKLFAICGNQVLYKPGSSWTDVTPTTLNSGQYAMDFEFSYQNAGKLIVSYSAYQGTSNIYVFNPFSYQWTTLNVTLPWPYSQAANDGVISFSVSGSDVLFCRIKADNTNINPVKKNWILMRTPLSSISWTMINSSFGSTDQIQDFEVSKSNSDIVYAAVYASSSLQRSTNGGASFQSISPYNHVDGRCLLVYSTTNTSDGINDVVYFGTDGGVGKKRSGSANAVSITGAGLAITEFYGFGNTEADEDIMTGGAQDNSGFTYIKDRTPDPWRGIWGGDGYTAKFRKNGSRTAYGEYNGSGDHPLYQVTFSTNNTTGQSSINKPTDLGISNINRPQYFDPSNNAFIGYSHIWKMPLSSSSWQRAFQNDPIDNPSPNPPYRKIVSDFYIHEANTGIVYIAYRDAAYNDPSQDQYGKLYYTSNANASSVSWTNISPGEAWDNCINSIAVDKKNSDRIWVALGNFNSGYLYVTPQNMEKRVKYSDDHGATWADASKGLPCLPVNKIIYQDGSDDVLFAATDVGVYRWNKDLQEWECFNNGMPPCIVMDLEFNYCAGKLRAATYGRGMWETPVVDFSEIPGPDEIITSATTWNSTKYLTGSVKITSGNTLTISGSTTVIHMPKNGRFIVEPNAQLIVNGATITNSCEGCMWAGIQIFGHPNQVQIPVNQGKVVLRYARIEYARDALTNFDEYNFDPSTVGGMIDAQNSLFYNCHRSVALVPYDPFSAPSPGPNSYQKKNYAASFSKCKFIVDDKYKGNVWTYPFKSHVTLEDVPTVLFSGCEFYNWITNIVLKGKGTGIQVIAGAGLRVNRFSTFQTPFGGTGDRNTFHGFQYGISVHGLLDRNYAVEIDGADFDSCGAGIWFFGAFLPKATNNSFKVGRGVPISLTEHDCKKNVGIFSEETLSPIIEDNYAEGVGSAVLDELGIVIKNSQTPGQNDQITYHNYLKSLDKGVYAYGENRVWSYYGLRIYCNTFENNANDIVVAGKSIYQGIPTQGVIFGMAAGNTFLTSSSVHINNLGPGGFDYVYSNGNNQVPTKTLGNVYLHQATTGRTCYSHYGDVQEAAAAYTHPWDNGVAEDVLVAYLVADGERNTLANELHSLIDGGNTHALTDFIDNYAFEDTTVIHDSLMHISPYVSETAFRHTAASDKVSTNQLMRELRRNPEVLKNGEFLSYLENDIPSPLSSEQINALTTASDMVSGRAGKESALGEAAATADLFATMMLNNLRIDSIGGWDDSTALWYDRLKSPAGDFYKAAYYTALRDFPTAETILNDIPNRFALSDRQNDAYEAHVNIWQTLRQIRESGRTIMEMDETEYNDITAATETDGLKYTIPYTTGTQFKNWIPIGPTEPTWPLGPATFDIECIGIDAIGGPDEVEAPVMLDTSQSSVNTEIKENHLSVYPNPAHNQLVFEYQLQTDIAVLTLTNAIGEIYKEINVMQKTGKNVINVQAYPAGVYFYKITSGGNTILTGKVVIVK